MLATKRMRTGNLVLLLISLYPTHGWTPESPNARFPRRDALQTTKLCALAAASSSAHESLSSAMIMLLDDPPDLTVIIPAYNEEFRIESTLIDYQEYFQNSDRWKTDRIRILVVDDGSQDGTCALVQKLATTKQETLSTPVSSGITLECLRMPQNGGKGAALAFGIAAVCRQKDVGSLILTADADGSAKIADLELLYASMVQQQHHLMQSSSSDEKVMHKDDVTENDADIWSRPILVNGYRTYESASPSRLVFRWGFRTVVQTVIADLGVQDSQCGFKLMTAAAAQLLYRNLHLVGWSHDVEVLYRAKLLGVTVAEEPIQWNDKEGSKLVASPGGVVGVACNMFWEVLRLRVAYASGVWKAVE